MSHSFWIQVCRAETTDLTLPVPQLIFVTFYHRWEDYSLEASRLRVSGLAQHNDCQFYIVLQLWFFYIQLLNTETKKYTISTTT